MIIGPDQSSVTEPKAKMAAARSVHMMSDPFVFVPISHNEASKGRGAAKRIVRAHVTRVQHAKSTTLGNHMHLQSWTVKPYIHREPPAVKRKPRIDSVAERKGSDQLRVVVRKKSSASTGTSTSSSNTDSSPEVELRLPKLPQGSTSADPFWTFPVDYRPELSPIFAHYIQNVAVDIPDIDGPNAKGLLRRVWFPLCMTEAATMYAVLLMAASHYCAINPSQAALFDLVYLKGRALAAIQAALLKPDRAVTDALIGAVAKMAAYEAIFGDSQVFAAHMRGLQTMLELRGGLSSLGLNGLLERMVVWINLNASHITGLKNDGFLALPTIVSFEAPDPFHFAGIS